MISTRVKGLSEKEKIKIVDKLSQLLEQGYSYMEALQIFYASSSGKQRIWIKKLMASLEEGKSIEEGFRQADFSEYINVMVAQAEVHGQMATALNKASEWSKRKLKIREEWLKLLIYPLMLLFILLLIFYLVFQLVIPQFKLMFQTFQVELPPLTAKSMAFFNFMHTYYWQLLVGGTLLVLLWSFIFYYAPSRKRLIHLGLRVPGFRHWLRFYFTSMFTIQLGFLLQAHVPLHQSIHSIKERCRSVYLQERLAVMEEKILKGEGLAVVVQAESIFLRELSVLIFHAQKNGKVGEQLARYGMSLEDEVLENWLSRMKWIEPLLLLIIGTCIAFLFMVLFAPILELIKVI